MIGSVRSQFFKNQLKLILPRNPSHEIRSADYSFLIGIIDQKDVNSNVNYQTHAIDWSGNYIHVYPGTYIIEI